MQDMITSLISKGNYDEYDIDDVCAMLFTADDEYEIDGDLTSFELSDAQYDVIKFNAKRLAPAHKYFTGVGSDVRGGKIDLPNYMPSLNQIEVGDIGRWIIDNNLHQECIVLSDKMDGVSIQLIYNADGSLRIAYSRGNGLKGADVTRHVRRMKKVPLQIEPTGSVVEIRAEVELSNSIFEELKTQVFKSDGSPYKNPRNMTAGMMNSSEAHQAFYDVVDVFTYEIMNTTLDKLTTLQRLDEMRFTVVCYCALDGCDLNDDKLAEYLNRRRNDIDYDIDGLVLTVDSYIVSGKLDVGMKGAANPKSSIKYKVADASNYHMATCTGVTYNVSKHAFGKPQINLEPFDIQGVTVSNTTGFNAKFIHDNNIGAGAKILMTRSGDVIPYVVKVSEGVETWAQPDDGYEYKWNDTAVDLVLVDPDSHPTVQLRRMTDFCNSLELPVLREGNVQKLITDGYDSVESILLASKEQLVQTLGANGEKAYDGIHKRLSNVKYYEIAGSVHAFGRGVGKRKFEDLFASGILPMEEDGTYDMTKLTVSKIIGVKGFEVVTAEKIMEGLDEFMNFWDNICHLVHIPTLSSSGSLNDEMIVFTGFRDKDLKADVESAGGKMQSSVNGKTTILVCLDPTSTSGKVKKARDKGVTIVSPDEIKERILMGNL